MQRVFFEYSGTGCALYSKLFIISACFSCSFQYVYRYNSHCLFAYSIKRSSF